MKPLELKSELEKRLQRPERLISYNRDEQQLRIEDSNLKKGVTLSILKLQESWNTKKEVALEEAVHYVDEALLAMATSFTLKGHEKNIFPVIRSTSFPSHSGEQELFFEEHTAETRIYYAIDRGTTFTLITKDLLKQENFEQEKMKEMALFNVRSLAIKVKKDQVAGNSFYFINQNDGYDASKILNEQLLKKYENQREGQLVVAVPHQDVLIIADIINGIGYDVLAQMVFQFFSSGTTPITALPFLYNNGDLEPIFILAQKKPKQ